MNGYIVSMIAGSARLTPTSSQWFHACTGATQPGTPGIAVVSIRPVARVHHRSVDLRVREVDRVAELVREDACEVLGLRVVHGHHPAVHHRSRLGDVAVVVGPLGEGDAEYGVARDAEVILEDRAVRVVDDPDAASVFRLIKRRSVLGRDIRDAGLAFDRAGDGGPEGRRRHVAPLRESELRNLIRACDRDERRDAVERIGECTAAVGVDRDRAPGSCPRRRGGVGRCPA